MSLLECALTRFFLFVAALFGARLGLGWVGLCWHRDRPGHLSTLAPPALAVVHILDMYTIQPGPPTGLAWLLVPRLAAHTVSTYPSSSHPQSFRYPCLPCCPMTYLLVRHVIEDICVLRGTWLALVHVRTRRYPAHLPDPCSRLTLA